MDIKRKIINVSLDDDSSLQDFLGNSLDKCIKSLNDGRLIVFPTETLYGLGVDIDSEDAIQRLLTIKGRPKNMPIAAAVANLEQVKHLVEVSKFAAEFIRNCMPRPITILLPKKDHVSDVMTGGSALLGLRFPDNPVTEAILKEFGPITATSANISGTENPINITQPIEQFGDKIDLYIDTGPCKYSGPSTVVDISKSTIKIIRHGVCSGDEIEKCIRSN